MNRFEVVQVIQDANPLPEWAPIRLREAGIAFSVRICWDREDLVREASDADLVWSYGGRHGLLNSDNLRVLRKCGAILRTGSGTDNIDVGMATELGIVVVNTPHVVADQVADHTISLLFSLVRQITRHDRLVRTGVWNSFRAMPTAPRFRGATLGMIGFGRIPRLIVHKLSGFGMKALAYDPFVDGKVMASYGVASVPLEDLLRASDYVSLHCPLTRETNHLIGERELRWMQPHALLINTARGSIVDEESLIRALQEGWIAGAGLDVVEQEPPDSDHPLLKLENVILTPHLAGYSDRYPDDFAEASVEAILDLAAGYWPRSVVNPSVIPRWPLSRRTGADDRTDKGRIL
jgi:D-3-phosphoglycerate dehydrogenase